MKNPTPYHVSYFASQNPDGCAVIFPTTGKSMTFGQLEASANRSAHALKSLGLERSDCIAISITNRPEFLALMLAAQRIGIHYVLLSTKLSVDDLSYIIKDSGAKIVILSNGCFASERIAELSSIKADLYGIDLPTALYRDWSDCIAAHPATIPDNCSQGREMLYSSGTTGLPKGIRKELGERKFGDVDPTNAAIAEMYSLGPGAIFLSSSPLYHAAPHRIANAALHSGATLVLPDRFDAAESLAILERYKCTHSLWVPTMFHRMLRLPEDTKNGTDLRSHVRAIHGAAPCPAHVKKRMIDWWGPIIDEYYSGSEGIGSTNITSKEWLEHPGSVGRPQGCKIHILDSQGDELYSGETGDIYFQSDKPFEYWGEAEKTNQIRSKEGWMTFGDVGYVDTDGYLYLTDRRHFTIISGGVNIYPQEIEDAFLEHDAVQDVAVIGIPNEEFGQEVRAVVQLIDNSKANNAMVTDLRNFIRNRVGPIKTPRSIVFEKELPRHATGKLYKKELLKRHS